MDAAEQGLLVRVNSPSEPGANEGAEGADEVAGRAGRWLGQIWYGCRWSDGFDGLEST